MKIDCRCHNTATQQLQPFIMKFQQTKATPDLNFNFSNCPARYFDFVLIVECSLTMIY